MREYYVELTDDILQDFNGILGSGKSNLIDYLKDEYHFKEMDILKRVFGISEKNKPDVWKLWLYIVRLMGEKTKLDCFLYAKIVFARIDEEDLDSFEEACKTGNFADVFSEEELKNFEEFITYGSMFLVVSDRKARLYYASEEGLKIPRQFFWVHGTSTYWLPGIQKSGIGKDTFLDNSELYHEMMDEIRRNFYDRGIFKENEDEMDGYAREAFVHFYNYDMAINKRKYEYSCFYLSSEFRVAMSYATHKLGELLGYYVITALRYYYIITGDKFVFQNSEAQAIIDDVMDYENIRISDKIKKVILVIDEKKKPVQKEEEPLIDVPYRGETISFDNITALIDGDNGVSLTEQWDKFQKDWLVKFKEQTGLY